jgi:hypothetical protein
LYGPRAMDVHAGIVEQWVRRIVDTYGARLGERGLDSEERRKSNAFCALCVATLLDLEEARAVDCLTDGGQDGGVDAIHVSETVHDRFTVSLFQAKYFQNLDGKRAFPGGELTKLIHIVDTIFDPSRSLRGLRDIAHVVEDIRSRISDGAIPQARVVLCCNGARWQQDGDALIERAGFDPTQVQWEFVNHRRLVELKTPREIDTTLFFEGDAAVEELSYRRVFVGRIGVQQIAALMDQFGDSLLERNIRRFLGPANRVNKDMMSTLTQLATRQNFYFFNNGITMICRDFALNGLQKQNFPVPVKGLQIINGAQTCKTIQHVLQMHSGEDFSQAQVMVRLYKIDGEDHELIDRITYATNSQTPIEMQDLRANDEVQRRLVLDVQALGYTYSPKRGMDGARGDAIGSVEAAEAVMAVWRGRPHVARTAGMKLFDQYYREVFDSTLTGAQLVSAALMVRDVKERLRRGDYPAWADVFMPYASHHLAAMVAAAVMREIEVEGPLNGGRFGRFVEQWRAGASERHESLIEILGLTLLMNAGDFSNSYALRRMSALFRGGMLAEFLLDYVSSPARGPDLLRELFGAKLEAWKQRCAGRGHQLELADEVDA